MAVSDCGFCEKLYNCNAAIIEKDFYTFAAKMLCEIADNTGGFGPVDAFNLTEIAGETLGANFYDQALQALQVSIVGSTGTSDTNLIEIAGETLGANFYDQALQAIQESIVANSAIEYDTGVVTTKTQRTVLATDVALPAGTNVLGGFFGNVASDAADSGAPVKIGFQARTSDITAVANADRVDGVADKIGRQIHLPFAIPENALSGNTGDITDTTSTQVIAAQAGSNRIYVTDITVSNMSASVATRVDLLDGNGGSVLWSGPAAAAGGGYSHTFAVPIFTTAATRLDAKCGTTGAQVRVSVSGYKGV